VTSDHQRNFRRGARIVKVVGRPITRFMSLPVSDATIAALDRPCLIASNHRSVIDAVAGIHAVGTLGHTARVMSAAWLWEDKRLAMLLDSIGAIPMRGGRAGLETVEQAIEILRSGEHVLITPEGRVVPEAERVNGVGDGHKVLSKIACGAAVDVIPAALVGTDTLWSLEQSRPTIRPWDRPIVGFGFGDPIEMDASNHRANVEIVMAEISDLITDIEPAVNPAA
jgi:1-acyl-sn-glycerol-3-phosphate acyltransferase